MIAVAWNWQFYSLINFDFQDVPCLNYQDLKYRIAIFKSHFLRPQLSKWKNISAHGKENGLILKLTLILSCGAIFGGVKASQTCDNYFRDREYEGLKKRHPLKLFLFIYRNWFIICNNRPSCLPCELTRGKFPIMEFQFWSL